MVYLFRSFPKLEGYLLRGPYMKGHRILGSILGSPYSRKLSFVFELWTSDMGGGGMI